MLHICHAMPSWSFFCPLCPPQIEYPSYATGAARVGWSDKHDKCNVLSFSCYRFLRPPFLYLAYTQCWRKASSSFVHLDLSRAGLVRVIPWKPLISSIQRRFCLPLRLVYGLGVYSMTLWVHLLSSPFFVFISWMMSLPFVLYLRYVFLTLSFLVAPTIILSIALSMTRSFFSSVFVVVHVSPRMTALGPPFSFYYWLVDFIQFHNPYNKILY